MKATTNNVRMPFGRLLQSTMKLLAAAALVGGMATAASAQDSINVLDPSFELAPYNPTWPHYTAAIPMGVWDASVTTIGINDASGPFWDNGGTVDGSRVGFIQNDGVLVQHGMTGFQVGETYWVQFFANARVDTGTPDVSVLQQALGNVWLNTVNITPSGGAAGTGNPFTFVNAKATATATTGDLYFNKGSHAGGGDSTLVLDGISIIRRPASDIVIMNPSFEASGTGQTFPGLAGTIAGWTVSGPAGPPLINQNGGPYLDSGEVVPDGNNVLVIQGAGAYEQTLHGLTPGQNYQLSLYINGRAGSQSDGLITIDGQTAYSGLVPELGSNPFQLISYDFTASAADVTLSIGQTTGSSYFVDNVRVGVVPEPGVMSLALLGGGLIMGFIRRQRR